MGTAQEALKSPERGRFPTCKHRHSLSALRVDGAVFQETSGGNSQENNLQLLSSEFLFLFFKSGTCQQHKLLCRLTETRKPDRRQLLLYT